MLLVMSLFFLSQVAENETTADLYSWICLYLFQAEEHKKTAEQLYEACSETARKEVTINFVLAKSVKHIPQLSH